MKLNKRWELRHHVRAIDSDWTSENSDKTWTRAGAQNLAGICTYVQALHLGKWSIVCTHEIVDTWHE